jgi:phosphomannomutase
LVPWAGVWEIPTIPAALNDPLSDVMHNYYGAVIKSGGCNLLRNSNSPIRFAYTAMHGVGYEYVANLFLMAKFPVRFAYYVEYQYSPLDIF